MSEKLPKTLIVDASILFSFFKEDSVRREIIEKLSILACRLISPLFAFKELMSDKERIVKFGKINELSFAFLFSLLLRKVEPIAEGEYKGFMLEANNISPHDEKVSKDDPYFALALAFNSAIWSDEKRFKKQSVVEVFNTKELIDLFKI